jgi:colicin import membrane protein
MGFATNLAAIGAANKVIKAMAPSLVPQTKEALKAFREEYFSIEQVDGRWHALLLKPLPSDASAQASPSLEAVPQEPQAPASEAAPQAGQQAFAAAANFFASRGAPLASEAEREAAQAGIDAADAAADDADDPDFEAARLARAQAEADALANAQQAESKLKNGKIWIHASSCPSPVKRVWAIADAMCKEAREAGKPMPSRKEIQDECVRQGVASGTSRTQYQAWKKANDNDAANAQRAAELSAALNSRSGN